MPFCPSCGKQLFEEEGNAKFCAYCGESLVVAEETAPLTNEEVVNNEPVNEAPVSEEPVNAAQPQQEKTPLFDVDDIKEKTIPVLNNVVEKAKTLPVLDKLLGKLDQKLYPVLLAVPVGLLVLIVVVVMLLTSSSGSYMSPMNDYIKLANKKETDAQKLVGSLAPDFRAKLVKNISKAASKSDSFADQMESAADNLEDIYDELDDEFDNWKIGFEVKSKEKMDKDDVEDLADSIEDAYDDYYESYVDEIEEVLDDDDELEDLADSMDVSEKEAAAYAKASLKYYQSFEDVKITEAYEVKGKFTIKADKDEWESETVKVIIVKINGDWAYAGLDDGDSIVFEDDDEEIALFNNLFYCLERNYLGDFAEMIY